MNKDILISFFRSLAPVSEEEEQLIRSAFTGLEVSAKSYLVRQGEVSHTVYFILKGCGRIGINTSSGEDMSCYLAQEMEWIGVYESFLTGAPSGYFVQMLEDCQLLAIDRLGLENIYTHTRYGNLIGRKLAENLFIQTVNKLADFYRYTPEERFQLFLKEYPGLANRIPQNCLASYIGVKPQSLSRIKKRVLLDQ